MTDADQPTTMAQVRGSVCKRLEGDAAWEAILTANPDIAAKIREAASPAIVIW